MDNENVVIANNIVAQLGRSTGNLVRMIGANTFLAGTRNLTFKFKSRAKNGANACRITLDAMDTYRVEFLFLRGFNVTTKGDFSDMHAEDLTGLFESETGLYLHL